MTSVNETFAAWLSDRARAAGYEIDGSRSGGKAKLAEDSGVSRGQVGRALAGDTIPDITSQRRLAKALRAPLAEMLIRSGLAEPEDFPEYSGARPAEQLPSLDRAIEAMGATEAERSMLVAIIESMLPVLRSPEHLSELLQEHAAEKKRDGAVSEDYRMRGASPTDGSGQPPAE